MSLEISVGARRPSRLRKECLVKGFLPKGGSRWDRDSSSKDVRVFLVLHLTHLRMMGTESYCHPS